MNNNMLAAQLLRDGTVIYEAYYELNGKPVRIRRIRYTKSGYEMIWSLTQIDGSIYKLGRIK